MYPESRSETVAALAETLLSACLVIAPKQGTNAEALNNEEFVVLLSILNPKATKTRLQFQKREGTSIESVPHLANGVQGPRRHDLPL